MNLHWTTYILVLLGVKTLHQMSYRPVPVAIRTKEVYIGESG
jgi:hypothetical protein